MTTQARTKKTFEKAGDNNACRIFTKQCCRAVRARFIPCATKKEKDRRANNPPPPPPAPRPPSSGSNNAAAPLAGRGPDVARQGGDSNGNSSNASLSSHASDSDEESEDSENLPWGLGRRTAAGKAAKGAASFLEEGIVGRRMDEESRKGLRNVPVGGGGGGGDGGDGERAQGADAVSREGSDDGGEDEADEDIHAR